MRDRVNRMARSTKEARKLKEVRVPPEPTVAGRRECLEELLLDDLEVMIGIRW
jgi:hypothetical protein